MAITCMSVLMFRFGPTYHYFICAANNSKLTLGSNTPPLLLFLNHTYRKSTRLAERGILSNYKMSCNSTSNW